MYNSVQCGKKTIFVRNFALCFASISNVMEKGRSLSLTMHHRTEMRIDPLFASYRGRRGRPSVAPTRIVARPSYEDINQALSWTMLAITHA